MKVNVKSMSGLFVLAAVFAVPSAMATPKTSDEAAIEKLDQRLIAAFNAKDADKVMSAYAPGNGLFVFGVGAPRQRTDWVGYKKDWQGLFVAYPGPIHVEQSDLAITVVGPVAYGHSIRDAYFTDKEGKRQHLVVRVSNVYRKQHGRWQITQEHVSVPIDFSTGKPDFLSKP